MPTVDGSSIKDFNPIVGDFACRFESWENKKAKTDGTDNVNMVFVVDEGENAGRKLFITKSLKPQALWSFKQICVALGADPEQFTGLFDTDDILRELVGSDCRISASVQTEGRYAGRQSVDEVRAPGFDLD